MKEYKLVQEIILKNGKPYTKGGEEITFEKNVAELAVFYSNFGADMLLVWDISQNDEEHEKNIDTVKEIVSVTDAPVIFGGNVKRLEDVKKYLYAGAVMTILDFSLSSNQELAKEAAERFGKDKIAFLIGEDTLEIAESNKLFASLFVKTDIKSEDDKLSLPVLYLGQEEGQLQTYHENAYGYCYPANTEAVAYAQEKKLAKEAGIPVITYEPEIVFSQMKQDENGLVPVIVQDYKTNEVLMLAYMNEEAYQHTLESGRMTYYSRSRKEQWEKGLTSGHFQYWKELSADCDKDTILAKVYQVGAACHTGKRSCFFNRIAKKDYIERNPYKVFEDVFGVILDRKEHPKEGSYTNYLFDKGIDKILKKCGEEATEIVIAAKNPNPEEIKYEISDFLYHVMVLMAEKGITWEDITTELARR